MLDKHGIAKRIAKELKDGWYVNLGIGIPTLVANYIPKGIEVTLCRTYWVHSDLTTCPNPVKLPHSKKAGARR